LNKFEVEPVYKAERPIKAAVREGLVRIKRSPTAMKANPELTRKELNNALREAKKQGVSVSEYLGKLIAKRRINRAIKLESARSMRSESATTRLRR
jgi:predicted CopG family antitoxin